MRNVDILFLQYSLKFVSYESLIKRMNHIHTYLIHNTYTIMIIIF